MLCFSVQIRDAIKIISGHVLDITGKFILMGSKSRLASVKLVL